MALTDNLESYYEFNTGALTTDSSGNSHTLTDKNSVAESSSGIIGYCANNGDTSNTKGFYRTADALTYTQIGTGWTVNLWVKNNDTSVDTIPFRYNVNNGSLERNFSLWTPQVATPLIMLSMFDGSGHSVTHNVTLTQGAWYMYTIKYDGSAARLYLNGSEVGTASTFTWSGYARNTLNACAIGCYMDNSGDVPYASVRGLYDEVGIWSRSLSNTEISDLYNGGAGLAYPFAGAAVFRRKALLGVGQ